MQPEQFNPERLRAARKCRRMTLTELGRKVGLSSASLSKYEAGVIAPNPQLITRIAKGLHFNKGFFYRPGDLFPAISYTRKKARLGSKERDRIDSQLNIVRWIIRSLIERLNYPDLSLPPAESTPAEDPEHAADVLRRFWALPRGPIKNLSAITERSGILVVPITFDSPEIDALTVTAPDSLPIIFISSDIPADRYRFTLAHEVGHLCMHRILPTKQMENEADLFAGAFLLPEIDIKGELHRINLKKLVVLKQRWRVSMAALLMRARQLQTIEEDWARYLLIELSRRGYRKKEPIEIAAERPQMLRQIIETYRSHFNLTADEIALAENVLVEDFRYWFGITHDTPIFQFRDT